MQRISGVVLAAGASTRMGTQKLLLPLGGEPLVRHTVRRMLGAGLDEVLVVVGHAHQEVMKALEGLSIRYAVNPDFATGLGSSFRTAVDQLGDADAAIFALADQPFVGPSEYRQIVETWRAKEPAIVCVRYGTVMAPPHLFTRRLFPELAALTHGARSVIERHRGDSVELQFPPELLRDIDTPEDYARVVREWPSGT
jgi:molybdenum cofactor cytidylyltransferase